MKTTYSYSIFIVIIFLFIGWGVTQGKEIMVDPSSCDRAQEIVTEMSEIVMNSPADKQLYEREAFGNIFKTEIVRLQSMENSAYPEARLKMEMNLMLGTMDWGESIIFFHSAKDFGSVEKNRKEYFGPIYEYEQKQKVINYICPGIDFPNFEYWNSVIQKNYKSRTKR